MHKMTIAGGSATESDDAGLKTREELIAKPPLKARSFAQSRNAPCYRCGDAGEVNVL